MLLLSLTAVCGTWGSKATPTQQSLAFLKAVRGKLLYKVTAVFAYVTGKSNKLL
jgi:hypothetical protein